MIITSYEVVAHLILVGIKVLDLTKRRNFDILQGQRSM